MTQQPEITARQLLQAYAIGIFPMAADGQSDALDWYDPPRRGIIPLDGIHLSRSLAKLLRQEKFTVTINTTFAEVMHYCATVGMGGNEHRDDTWISPRIMQLYGELHSNNHAYSLEVWQDGALVGGLYGVTLGRAFFGESMFSRAANASKVAMTHLLARLLRQGFTLCDTQYLTPHLASFGGIEIPRADYKQRLAVAITQPADFYSASVSSGTTSSAAGADVAGAAVASLLAGATGAAG